MHKTLDDLLKLISDLSDAGVKVEEFKDHYEMIGECGQLNVWKNNPVMYDIMYAFYVGYTSK